MGGILIRLAPVEAVVLNSSNDLVLETPFLQCTWQEKDVMHCLFSIYNGNARSSALVQYHFSFSRSVYLLDHYIQV